MKRIFAWVLGLLLCLPAAAQAQLTTKKEKLSDFAGKTLKVVLPGQPVLDEALRQAAKEVWALSPYETCTKEEYDRLRTSDSWYFLATRDVRDKKRTEGGITFLCLLKGGAKQEADMMEVARLPLCAAGAPSGREAALLPALLETLQIYVRNAQASDFKRLGSAIGSLKGSREEEVWLVRDELADPTGRDLPQRYAEARIHLTDAAGADAVVRAGEPALVGFCIRPAEVAAGDTFHLYVIDARTLEIRWFKTRKAGSTAGAGFLKSDLNALIRR